MPDRTHALVGATFAERPWRRITQDMVAAALAVPSMLSFEESQLYHWLGLQAQGIGATIDLGAFAGGSAARLLEGLRQGGKPHHLHAYDHFTASASAREKHLTPNGVPLTDQDDILPLVEGLLAPWKGHFTLHRGDIRHLHWPGEAVEILAIDAGKTPALTDHIADQFFPGLVPGQSVVIHQDFLRPEQPWLAVMMQGLAAHFRPLAHVASDCVVFLCTSAIPPAALAAAKTVGLDDANLIKGVQAARTAYAPLLPRARFGAMIQLIRANPGVRKAWRMQKN